MSRHGVAVDHITPLDRLGYLGVRGMGALEFVPDTGPNGPSPTAIDLSDLIVAARAAVHGSLLDDNEAQRSLQEIIDVGTSAGGARAKAILNINAETGEIRSGHLPPLSGYQPWLLKFDGVGVDRQLGSSQVYGRIEYAYSHMARAAGIHMAESQLLQENGRAHFISRRFDRDSHGNKVHMQTLCALYGVDYRLRNTNDYSQLMMCIRELGLGQEALVEGFRRAVFNVATMNRDDHAKNFAFLLPHEGAWQLSPAYDVTFAYNPQGVWTAHHQMGINGTFDNITRADLLRFADEHGVQAGGAIISDVLDAVASWPEFARHAGLTSSSIDEVSRHFQHLARRRP
jgi:serine/threonine-protein kinase HipA